MPDRIGEHVMTTAVRFGHLLFGVALATLASAGALADTTTPPADPAAPNTQPESIAPATDPSTKNEPAKKADEEVVCKKEPAPLGSRIGAKKVCRTVAEWRAIQAVAKEVTDEIQSRKVPPPAS